MPRKTTTSAKRGVKPPTHAKPQVRTGPAKPPRSARRPARGGTKRDEEGTGRGAAKTAAPKRPAKQAVKKAPAKKAERTVGTPPDIEAQLQAIEQGDGDGEVELGRGRRLHVSSLGRVVFPDAGVTKGAVMRYYTRMSRFMLPDLDGRPLILKRYPTGVGGEMFFQQDAGPHVPDVVTVHQVETVDKGKQDRIVGGDLATLLYTIQLGAIEVHPWFSRVQDPDVPDRSLIDLDPGEGVPFAWVVELAQEIVRIARQCELPVVLKTSGSRGIHLVFPLPARSTYEASARLAELVAQAATVARPDLATVERSIRSRPERSIYVDAMQNAHGKSMAAAYSLRARAAATASAPLRPRELTPRLKLTGFTVTTMPARSERIGDIWREGLGERPTARALARAMQVLEGAISAPARSGRH
jgi:bifunctional non-homologous end joining protein LigD